jgi:hypothetical protein
VDFVIHTSQGCMALQKTLCRNAGVFFKTSFHARVNNVSQSEQKRILKNLLRKFDPKSDILRSCDCQTHNGHPQHRPGQPSHSTNQERKTNGPLKPKPANVPCTLDAVGNANHRGHTRKGQRSIAGECVTAVLSPHGALDIW